MTTAVAFYLLFLAAILVIVMLRDHVRGRTELFSIRNFAILGFIVFQLTSASIALFRNYEPYYALQDPEGTALVYAARCTVFLMILFWFYRWGIGAKAMARITPTVNTVPPEAFMWLVAAVLVFLSIVLRTAVRLPYVGVLADYVGVSFAAIACGMAGWIWAKRFLNPVAIVYAMMILVGSSASVIIGAFGRRGLVAVGAGMLWGMYYSRWRFASPSKVIGQLLVAAAVPGIALALYTSVRSAAEKDRNAIQHVQAMVTQGDLLLGFALLLDGQGTGSVSMWLQEQHPENFEYRWFHTPVYFVTFPVPRAIYPYKRGPLSNMIPSMVKLDRVDRKILTIGPGVIGHAGAEGGWIAIFAYGAMAGLFLRFFDEIICKSPYSPFVVLPVGCALGQVIGMARGETGVFAFWYTFSVIAAYISVILVAKVVTKAGLAKPAVPASDAHDWYDEDAQDEWQEMDAHATDDATDEAPGSEHPSRQGA